MFDLAALWLIIWLIKNAAVDVSCALKGMPNPRYEAKANAARAAGQPLSEQHRYGLAEWWRDLLADGLRAQTQWRRDRATKHTKRNLPPTTTTNIDEAPAKPTTDDGGEVERVSVIHRGPTVVNDHSGKWSWSCRRPGCPGKGFDYATEAEALEAAKQHRCPGSTFPREGVQINTDPPAEPEATKSTTAPEATKSTTAPEATKSTTAPEATKPTTEPTAPVTTTTEPTARIIPFPSDATTTDPDKEHNMSTTINTEIVGLTQSIAYAEDLAKAAGEHAASGNEGYIGHLTNAGVGGECLRTAHEMQEAFANAHDIALRHAEELRKQLSIQEAYASNPDAGDKQFQLAGN